MEKISNRTTNYQCRETIERLDQKFSGLRTINLRPIHVYNQAISNKYYLSTTNAFTLPSDESQIFYMHCTLEISLISKNNFKK